MNYVMHICRNPKCKNGWIDKDLTQAQVNPPNWKYCRECCKKLEIDYDAQTPDSNLTAEELAHKNKLRERAKLARNAKQNINSVFTEQGQKSTFIPSQA